MAGISVPSPDTILVSRAPGETRYALLEGETVIEVRHVRDGEIQPGAIYAARAGARMPNGKALFVDIGDVDDAVLPVKHMPSQGAALAVQVMVPARADKGAELKASDVKIPQDAKVPSLLRAAPEPVMAWFECYGDGIARIVCAPRAEVSRLKAALSGAAVEEHASAEYLFAAYGVDAAIEAALQPHVALPCGGSIIIEATAAVTAIDVNAGPAEPRLANAEAIDAAARALRLRNISGHIVLDIIPSKRRSDFVQEMEAALTADPTQANVAGLTPMGMIELTRQRVGLSLAEMLCDADGRLSTATVAYRLLREGVRFAHGAKAAALRVSAAPEVVALLQGPLRAALVEAEDMIKGGVTLTAREGTARARFDIEREAT